MQISFREADQRLYFHYIDSMIPLLSKFRNFKPLAIFCDCTAWFVLDQLGNQNVGFLMTRFNFVVGTGLPCYDIFLEQKLKRNTIKLGV